MHHHRRAIDALRDLQIADDFFAFEGNLATLQRRVHIGRGFEKSPQRALVAVHFFRAARHRITADAVILVGEIVSFAGFFSCPVSPARRQASYGAELAPLAPPQIRVETGEAPEHLDFFFHPLERIDPPGAMGDIALISSRVFSAMLFSLYLAPGSCQRFQCDLVKTLVDELLGLKLSSCFMPMQRLIWDLD